jgi:hypothetical protein
MRRCRGRDRSTWREKRVRADVLARRRYGPTIYIAGPYLESSRNVARMRSTPAAEMVEPVERTRWPVGSPQEARAAVDTLARAGVDLIKFRTFEDAAPLRAIGQAGARSRLETRRPRYGASTRRVSRIRNRQCGTLFVATARDDGS